LHVGQEFRLKAGPDFLQRVNEPRHLVRCALKGIGYALYGLNWPRRTRASSSESALRTVVFARRGLIVAAEQRQC
jgi:hypothetical protein